MVYKLIYRQLVLFSIVIKFTYMSYISNYQGKYKWIFLKTDFVYKKISWTGIKTQTEFDNSDINLVIFFNMFKQVSTLVVCFLPLQFYEYIYIF